MGRSDEKSDLQSKLELVIEGNPNTILIVDKHLTLKEVVVAKDELYLHLKEVAIGKRPEDIFSDEDTLSQYVLYKKAVIQAIEENRPVETTNKIHFNSNVYHYLLHAIPYKEDLAIVYVRNIDLLSGQQTLHELINTILDRLPMGVFVKDAENNFNYLYWNKFMEDVTGIKTSTIEGHCDLEVSYDAFMTVEERLQLDRSVIRTGKPVEIIGKIKKASGDFMDIEVTKFPISLSNGKPLLLALWRDITSKLKVENDLKRTMVLTKMALISSDIRTCSLFVNPDSKVDFIDTVVQMNNWETNSNTMVNVTWEQFQSRAHPDDKIVYRENFTKLCKGELQDIKMEVRMMYPGKKQYFWREVSAYVYERDEKGRPIVLLGCSTNIQERKSQELNLEEAKEKAEVADRMKSKYLADMSHEIRTPLNAITGFSELMAFADSDEERQSYYEIIKTNNQLLMQLINDILDLSKIEADVVKISYTPIDVNELMDTTFASVRLRMPEGVKLVLEKDQFNSSFGADSIRLLQLINNLANNAIKNTKEGSITMGYKHLSDGQLMFYVKDTGVGIAEEKLGTLFTRFVKLNDYVEGIGLGLAICQGLVAKMGGSMNVESELGVGSTFSFILPSNE